MDSPMRAQLDSQSMDVSKQDSGNMFEEFGVFTNERIQKQFLIVKQLIEGDLESADQSISELLGLIQRSPLPNHIKKQVVYGFIDILMFKIQHLSFTKEGTKKEDLLSFADINKMLTTNDFEEIERMLLVIYRRIIEFENHLKNSSKMKEVLNYIDTNYRDPELTLNSIAQNFELNHTYVSNTFKKEFGYNILELIHIRRITEAKYLLENTQQSVSEIAYKVGYYSYRTLSNIFKRLEKMTPTQFRELKENFKSNGLTKHPSK